jgi:hypothetical protein
MEFEAKLIKMEKIQQAKAKKNQIALEKKRKEIEILARKREQQLKTINDAKASKNEIYLKKMQEHEEAMAEFLKERDLELKIEKEGREIINQLKLDNVERLKRSQEYKRQETQKKILESKVRAEELIRKKSDLAEQRKRATRDAKIKKDKIVALLQNSKMGGGSSQNILKLISSMEDDVRKSTNEDNGRLFLYHSFFHALHNCKQVT